MTVASTASGLSDPALLGAIETRNRVMTDVSLALRAQATARRDRAHDKLSIAAHDWQQIILAVGGVAVDLLGLQGGVLCQVGAERGARQRAVHG